MASISVDIGTPTSCWLSDTSGLTADLVTGTANDLTNTGVSLTTGLNGDAGDFDDTDSLSISSPTGLDFGSNDFTIATWVNIDTQPNAGADEKYTLFGKVENDKGYILRYRIDAGVPKLQFLTGTGTGFGNTTLNQTLSNSTWYRIVISKSGSTATIYVNGSSIGSGSAAATISPSTNPFAIGYNSTYGPFDGKQHQVIIDNGTAWDSSDVITDYNSGAGIPYAEASTAPVVSTQAASSVASTTATLNGNVTSDGGDTVTERGFYYSTSPTVTTGDTKVTAPGTTGAYTYDITGLSASTTYYYRAFATNSIGTTLGDTDVSFTTTEALSITDGVYALDKSNTTNSAAGEYLEVSWQDVAILLNALSFIKPVRTITASATLGANDYTVLCDASSGAITVTLPEAANSEGKVYVIKKIDATNNVTIDGDGSETIDGATTKVLSTQYASAVIQSDGTEWHVLSE